MRVLGIDPGSVICGYGVIESQNSKLYLVEYGVIKAKKINDSIHIRLKEIYKRLNVVIERTKPDLAAFESMFYSKNAQSLIKLSQARAAAILSAVMFDIDITEYSPREVKKSITGNGNAGKQQVQFMVRTLLSIEETPEFFDSTDALAVAICHVNKNKLPGSKSSSWGDFIKNNPNRVVKQV